MQRYIIRRLAFMVLSVLGATILVFTISRLRGDPLFLYAKPGGYGYTEEQQQALRKELNLDKPLMLQYVLWVGRLAKGDLGQTLNEKRPVITAIKEKVFNTLQLALAAGLYAVLLGLPLGVLSAVRRGSVWDYLGRGYALLGMATPSFWIGLMAIIVFAVKLDWLPSAMRGPVHVFPLNWANVRHFIMPAMILGWFPAAGFLRITRSAMLEVLDSEFIKFARGKGVGGTAVIWKHAFKNALIPPLTMMAVTMGAFIHGSVVIETVFSWPGMGRLAVESVYNNDFPTLTGCVLVFALGFVVANFLADVAYAYLDPRIRYD